MDKAVTEKNDDDFFSFEEESNPVIRLKYAKHRNNNPCPDIFLQRNEFRLFDVVDNPNRTKNNELEELAVQVLKDAGGEIKTKDEFTRQLQYAALLTGKDVGEKKLKTVIGLAVARNKIIEIKAKNNASIYKIKGYF